MTANGIEYMSETNVLWAFALDNSAARFLASRNIFLDAKDKGLLSLVTQLDILWRRYLFEIELCLHHRLDVF